MPGSRLRGAGGSIALVVAAALLFANSGDESRSGASPGPASAVHAFVSRVIDGDTIEVRLGGGREEVRYIGVDTPETVKPGTPLQCFGHRATAFNRQLTEGRTVRLVPGVERRDAYGRLLAYVHVRGLFVNAALVRRGLARSLTIAPNDRFAPQLRRLERRAALAGKGLWSRCPP
jgi:micrococcal nuclease